MSEEELHRTKVPGLLVDLRCFRPAHRVRAVGRAVQPGTLDPGMYDPQVLPRRKVRPRSETAGEQVAPIPEFGFQQPILDRRSRLRGNFELDRSPRFLLDHGATVANPAARPYVINLKTEEIAAAELAINRKVE
jgi:hypothetical protein